MVNDFAFLVIYPGSVPSRRIIGVRAILLVWRQRTSDVEGVVGVGKSEVISMLMGMFPAGLSVCAYVSMMNAAVGLPARRGSRTKPRTRNFLSRAQRRKESEVGARIELKESVDSERWLHKLVNSWLVSVKFRFFWTLALSFII